MQDEQKLEAALKEIGELKAALKTEHSEMAAFRLAAIVESSDDAIIGKDLHSIITTWNKGAEGIFGYTAGEMIGTSIMRLIPADRQDEENHILGKIKSGESVEHFETQRQTKDGRLIHVSVTASPIKDAEVKVIGASKVARDITERKQVEVILLEREEQLRLYLEHSPAAIAMFDRDMKYLVVSRRWLESYRLVGQSIIGRSHYEIFPEIPQRWREIHRRCLAGAVEKNDEEPFLRADGKTDWIRWEVRPWMRADGSIGGIIIFSEDITERKQAEASLSLFRSLIDQSSDGIEIIDPETGRFLDVNETACQRLGYKRDELLSMSVPDIEAVAVDFASWHKLVEEFRHDGFKILEGRHKRKDGSTFPVEVSVRYIKLDRDYLIAAVRDITERKLVEAALRESEQRLRFTLESCNIGAWNMDLVDHTAYRSLEHARIFGYAEVNPQWTLEDFLHHVLAEYRAEVEAMVRKAMDARLGWTYECPIRRVDGEIRWIWFTGRHFTDPSTGHNRVGGVVMDT